MSTVRRELRDDGVRLLAEDAKLALVATLTPQGLPHVTLITSMQAKSPRKLMFGQFCEGLSKTHVAADPDVGFLALDRHRHWLRGRARWTSSAKQGDDYELFNRKPMFRYNAYFGIHTVHYLDLVEAEDLRVLATAPLVAGALRARLAATMSRPAPGDEALTPLARRLVAAPSALKFLAYRDGDGYPAIVPAFAAAVRGGSRVVLVPTLGAHETPPIAPGSTVALFAIDLEMRSVLLRGMFRGWRGPFGSAALDVEWVYNSMPPKHGQIYPPVPLAPVEFGEMRA